jgi:hypothetical protein
MKTSAKVIAIIVVVLLALSVGFALAQTMHKAKPGTPAAKMTQKAPGSCCMMGQKGGAKPGMKPGTCPMGSGAMGKPGMMGGMMGGMGGMHPMMPPAIAVDDTSVYVLRGPELLKFNKDTLELEKQVMLPAPSGGPGMGMPPH